MENKNIDILAECAEMLQGIDNKTSTELMNHLITAEERKNLIKNFKEEFKGEKIKTQQGLMCLQFLVGQLGIKYAELVEKETLLAKA